MTELMLHHDVEDVGDESFVISSVIAHVLTFSAHRRQLARLMLRRAGAAPDAGDPIEWWQRRTGGLR